MQHFVLTYRYVDDYMARRDAFRAEHLARLQKAVDEYESGQKSADKFIALVKKYQNFEKLDTVCRANSADELRAFAKDDPYYHAGLIASFEVEPWTVAVGVPQILRAQ